MTFLRAVFVVFCLPALNSLPASGSVIDSDICVYGGTSGGVTASVAAARLGKNVSLVVVNNHVGGMSAGGLGVTDTGNTASIGGLAKEFYLRVGQAYGSASQVYYFEPHVAEQAFNAMLSGAGVQVFTNEQLASVMMSNQVITQIVMSDGTIYRAREFIDATYEGDLMAGAGVTFTVGREGTNVYNESLAGIVNPGGSYNYDPYVVAGNPASGLLPLVQSGSVGTVGQGDNKVQVYNFRLCLTQNATNQIPITSPVGYSESQYELVRRYVAARVAKDGSVNLNQLIDVQTIIPNGKTDINANGELSTDYIGYNFTYSTNTYAGRTVTFQQHQDYTRGLLYFFGTSTNIPLNVRTQMQSWGLAKDEFQDTGGWPPQLYVREARRMVGDYVMTQGNTLGTRIASDPIALGSYTLDCHPVERIASGGFSRQEGGIGTSVPFPYGISYRSIVPSVGQCQNLFCTFALSASHVGFASLRLEPPFMMTSQSAGTAAAFAIDDNVPVQQVSYVKLAAQLVADGEILQWTNNTSTTNGIILDQSDPGVSSSSGWTFGANAGGWNGNYFHDQSTGKGTKWVYYNPTLPTNGTYDIYLWWVTDPNRSTNTPVDIVHSAGTNRVLVNQRVSSGGWFKIFSTNFNAGGSSAVIIRNDNTLAGTYCIADAVRWQPVGNALPPPPPPTVEIVASDAVANEFPTNTGRFTFVRQGDTNSTLTVLYSVGGTASNGVDYTALSGTIQLPAGSIATNIVVTPFSDNVAEGDRTVSLQLLSSASYTLDGLSNATVVIKDRPVDAWRFAIFTGAELSNAAISGDSADPDQDGLPNLLEYAMGLSPKSTDATPFKPSMLGGSLTITYQQSKAATDVVLVPECSTDMKNWNSGALYFQTINVVDQGTTQLITVRCLLSAGINNGLFVRMRANRL